LQITRADCNTCVGCDTIVFGGRRQPVDLGPYRGLPGSLGMSLLDLDELLLVIWVDDPRLIIRGVRDARTRRLAVLLLGGRHWG
jgi:hypothetical protein